MLLDKHLRRKKQSKYYIDHVIKNHIIDNLPDNFVSRSGYTKNDLLDKVNDQKICGNYVLLDYNNDNSIIDNMPVIQSNYCNNKLTCVLCSSRHQNKKRKKYQDLINDIANKYQYAYFVTYTIKNGEDLQERLDHLRDSLKRFRKMGQKRKGFSSQGEFSKVGASITNIEAKKGKNSGTWHVHAHSIFFTNTKLDYKIYDTSRMSENIYLKYLNKELTKKELLPYTKARVIKNGNVIPLSKISEEWNQVTGDSYNLHVSPIEKIFDRKLKKKVIPHNKIAETLKYSTKISTTEWKDYIEIMDVFHGRRSISTTGDLYGVGIEEDIELNDPVSDKKDYVVLNYQEKRKAYTLYNDMQGKFIPDLIKNKFTKKALQKVGYLLDKYRRDRKELLEKRTEDLFSKLNNLKNLFKMEVGYVWKSIRSCNKDVKT